MLLLENENRSLVRRGGLVMTIQKKNGMDKSTVP